jgi:hypothetical protein
VTRIFFRNGSGICAIAALRKVTPIEELFCGQWQHRASRLDAFKPYLGCDPGKPKRGQDLILLGARLA